ncbi:hypothetical protein [Streptomyces bacillaris]|uniref:hypothetical protein n=1 Tax=Streptomyces bacillaris TaxID=68179 RepID=UPI003653CE2A
MTCLPWGFPVAAVALEVLAVCVTLTPGPSGSAATAPTAPTAPTAGTPKCAEASSPRRTVKR